MDRYSGKRGADRITAPRKGHNVGFKDATFDGDQNGQFCNRIGCRGRIKYNSPTTKTGSSEKAKCSKPNFCSSNGNEMIGNSSRSSSVITRANGSHRDHQSGSVNKSREVIMASNIRSRKMIEQKSGSNNQSTSQTSSIPSISKSSCLGNVNSSNRIRYAFRNNMKCDSISDVAPPSSSSSESKSAEKNVMTKRSHDAKNVNNSKTRLSYRQNGRNSSSVRESSVRISESRDSESPVNVGGRSSLGQIPANGFSSGSSSYSLSSSNDDNQSTMTPYLLQRYDMVRVAEVLLALERIEQDEELTHEQVLSLETSLFLSGLNLFDQHRDMRLDIDNMSYEELLALEERMGTVSTALSEDALLKCISRSIYTPSEVRDTGLGEDGDDIKCTICQEEYVMGDEIGKLVECQHGYHATCINQWLRLKNWCPVCKAAADSPKSSSS